MKIIHVATIASALVVSHAATAGLIMPPGIGTGPTDQATFFNDLETTIDIVLLYKGEYDDGVFGAEESDVGLQGSGPDGPSFFISNLSQSADKSAEIEWNLTGTGYMLSYVAWKAGSSWWYSGVHADQRFEDSAGPYSISTDQAISHISFYGRPGDKPPGEEPPESVPDGGTTLVSLGLALLGLGSVRRLVARKG